ncbi:cytochrome P450 [Pseudonocardia sp. KRD-184]|uniref:Cytochrome P450 n=1 Tax=Pseudonocardia oceani TaxID=2792013 RepID=A0ABS6U7Q1_9PSEU|nr:cytochrome P450 [Pseudonocardia oceani]MBW0092125.1 cytochrome P450 [Pseudonocardia oceani]MBW0099130.1 cytochrome P450 [Pseudonocardia oceani]MBW0111646.1 cytochrome P450 [Pseudonocardia oceani]MBW0125307.1 cytochrome P450 [Pseudonocardia oceani]MBW0128226.1 cytochrome P450 [Pseudonocardia oceani]
MHPDAATRHEWRLLLAARPALAALLLGGRVAVPIRRVPRLGWVSADPLVAREVLTDHRSFTLLGEGGVGHLWAQVLGDWVYDLFDGAGHHDLRSRARDLFTEATATALVRGAWSQRLERAREALAAGEVVDVADLARVLVGRMLASLLGLGGLDDDRARALFATGERLAATALGSAADTTLTPAAVAGAKAIVDDLTRGVPDAWAHAGPETLLGRCRELGLGLRETTGLSALLMVAGTETAASAMGRTVALLHDTGAQHRLLADPAALPDAVREGLRVTTPAPVIGRSVRRDVTVAGRRLRAGERVVLLTWTANTAPGGFDLDRPYLPDNRQLWFGAGRHLCLGAPLARAELGAALQTVTAAGRPWTVVRRAPARRALVPTYRELAVRHV